MPVIGTLILAIDDAQKRFVFGICPRCVARLDRLPPKQQKKQSTIAFRNLAKDPSLCAVSQFDTSEEAHLFGKLETMRLTGRL